VRVSVIAVHIYNNGIKLLRYDELDCLLKGINFLLKNYKGTKDSKEDLCHFVFTSDTRRMLLLQNCIHRRSNEDEVGSNITTSNGLKQYHLINQMPSLQ